MSEEWRHKDRHSPYESRSRNLGMRICPDCGNEKSIKDDFYIRKGKRLGEPHTYCKECEKERIHNYYKNNKIARAKRNEYEKKYRKENILKCRIREKKYRKKNKIRLKQYRENNKDSIKRSLTLSFKKSVINLTDRYIIKLIMKKYNLSREITENNLGFIEIQRQILKVKRLIKLKENEKCS